MKVAAKILLLVGVYTIQTHSAIAQKSASAVMQVSVNVVSGANASVQSPMQYLTPGSTTLEAGNVVLATLPHSDILVSTPEKAPLVNKHGNLIAYAPQKKLTSDPASGVHTITMDGDLKSQTPLTGHYFGHLKTTVEYL
ncbi:MAG: hypothetical protein AAFW89_09750 [Bacteroidota bacterium]